MVTEPFPIDAERQRLLRLPADDAPMRVRLLTARLLGLLLKLRVSGTLAYRHRTGFVEQQRRVLTLVGNYEGLTSVELVGLTGAEKAQVSRTIAVLAEKGLVERESLRAPIQLSPEGQAAFERIMEVAKARNAEITDGIAPDRLARFGQLTAALTERAKLLLAQERDTGQGTVGTDPPPMPERLRRPRDTRPLARMVAPPLITLVAFLQRSATLAFRRETGLSNFEWQVMSQVGEYAPVPLLRLIELVGRDKSQVGRTVKRLEAMAFVMRAAAGGRAVTLDLTAAGRAVYLRMCRIAVARDDFLLAELGPEERREYLAVVDRLTANADALLAREREVG